MLRNKPHCAFREVSLPLNLRQALLPSLSGYPPPLVCFTQSRKTRLPSFFFFFTHFGPLSDTPFLSHNSEYSPTWTHNLLDSLPPYGHAGCCRYYVDSARQSVSPRVCMLCRWRVISGEVPERGIVNSEHKSTHSADKC